MESLEILKRELITQKAEIEQKGGRVSLASINPSPSEITAGIKTINVPNLADATAVCEDVCEGKTFYAGNNELKYGTRVDIDLSNATATAENVELGKTFYAGDNNIKTGTKVVPDLTIADALEENVEQGKTFYAGNNEIKTGNRVIPDLSLADATEEDVAVGKKFYSGSNEIKIGTKEESSGGEMSDLNFRLFVIGDATAEGETIDYVFPQGIKSTKSHLFYESTNKSLNLTFNTDLEVIAGYTFYKAEKINLTNFNELSNLKMVDTFAFGYAGMNLTLENLSNVLTTVEARAFFATLKENSNIILPKSLQKYGNYAFANDTKLEMKNLIMPDDIELTSVGSYGFSNLMFDCDFKIPSTISALPANFMYGTSFNNITIPATCTAFGNAAFYMLKTEAASYRRLKTVTFESATPPTFGTYPFADQDITNNFKIYVPDEAVDTYKAVSRLSSFANYIYPVSQKE